MKVLIVGGVAGGASAAARLRRLDENHEIVMLEKGDYISFANCGLPYFIGGEIKDKVALTLQTPQSFNSRFNVDVRIKSEVIAINKDKKTVAVKCNDEIYEETYDKLILSMGAEPIKPPIEGINSKNVFTLRNIPDTYKIKDFIDNNKPKTAIVVGGGYIGIEMAENLKAQGLSVTIVEMAEQVIGPLDYDMACNVHNHILSKGVNLLLANGLSKIEENGNNLTVTLKNWNLTADMVILAIGVKPESKIAKAANLECNERGGIIVNEYMQTSDEDIYAVGDAIEVVDFITKQKALIPLAGPANKQGRIAADNICDIKSSYQGTQGSAILKVFDLTVATTGINEKTAKRLGLNYEKSFTLSASHAGYYPGATNMTIKTIFNKDSGLILGAQIIGYEGVDKRCDVIATAIRAKMTAKDLTNLELCYAPPYSSAKDPVNMAGYVIENILTKKVKIAHYHDIAELQKRDDVILLDVRTALEYESGSIDKFINIPLDLLRRNLNTLDKAKKIYVLCQTGLRSYLACRILLQKGFDCYNISGGYSIYNSIYRKNTQEVVVNTETQRVEPTSSSKVIKIDACGLQCPGPILKLSDSLKNAQTGEVIEIATTDPAFASDIEGFCKKTGNQFIGIESAKGISFAKIRKQDLVSNHCKTNAKDSKNVIVFSGDLDKAIASFIIANAAAAMGRHVEMFFTFWGLNILRKSKRIKVKKKFIEKMFGFMMPKGSKKLKLSNMNMFGMGPKMIRGIMKKKNVDSLEDLIKLAQANGVQLIACSMSMDVMGLKIEELVDGVKVAGATAMLANAEDSDMSLFI